MDSTLLMLSLLFGVIGMGMFAYGKKASRLIPLLAGGGLMAVPYFISSVMVLMLVGAALVALPWVVKEG